MPQDWFQQNAPPAGAQNTSNWFEQNAPPPSIAIRPTPVSKYKQTNLDTSNTGQDTSFNKIIDFIRPFVGQAAGAGSAILASPTAPFTAGASPVAADIGGYTAADMLMKKLKAGQNNAGLGEDVADSAKNALINMVGGKIISGLFRGAAAFYNASVPEIYKFSPTTSQALESYGFHKLATLSKFAEDFGASGAKKEAQDRAGGAGFTQALKVANALNGRTAATNIDPVRLADKIRESLEDAILPSPYKTMPFRPNLELPVHPGYPDPPVLPDMPALPNKPQIYESMGDAEKTRLMNQYNQTVNDIKAGHKQNINDIKLGYKNTMQNIDSQFAQDTQAAKLAHGRNMDQYKVDLANFQAADPLQPSEEALNILSGGANPFSKVDAVIKDPDRLGKVLGVGQLMGKAGENLRGDLQAYQFMRMVNDATTTDAKTGAIRIDAQKIANVWNDKDLRTSMSTLFGGDKSPIRQNINDFIKNVATTQDKMNTYPIAKQLRFMGSGFQLIGDLFNSTLTLAKAGTFAGLYLPTAVVGNLLTKTSTARIVTAMAGGEPLGQSKQLAAKLLLNAIQGSATAIMDADGKKKWGTISKDENGQFKFEEAR